MARRGKAFILPPLCALALVLASASCGASSQSSDAHQPSGIETKAPASLRFSGNRTAELFTRESDESLRGVLEKSFVGEPSGPLPIGFVNASLPGFPWAGTMWTRDAGTFMRELVMRGYYAHASLLAECLMHLVQENDDGYYLFPEYFKGAQQASGKELDGTASIIIGMVLLAERLPASDPTREHINTFLFDSASPLAYFQKRLRGGGLIAGSGEFGCGFGFSGECVNVVQNDLIALSLMAAGNLAEETRHAALAKDYRSLASGLQQQMLKHLVGGNDAWIWAIDPKTLQPNPAILSGHANLGFGGLNGIASMYPDVLGLDPLQSAWPGIQVSEYTFQRLYETPLRKREFDEHGIWTQFDTYSAGLTTSPSYGQAYAMQAMLLFDKLDMVSKALDWLANATYDPIAEYTLHRDSRYYFYERYYPPEAVGKVALEEGCGALNLVNVSEPLKISRLILGVDDSTPSVLRIIPRLPTGWTGMEANNWPVRTTSGVVYVTIKYTRNGSGADLALTTADGGVLPQVSVRMPSAHGTVWKTMRHVNSANFETN